MYDYEDRIQEIEATLHLLTFKLGKDDLKKYIDDTTDLKWYDVLMNEDKERIMTDELLERAKYLSQSKLKECLDKEYR